MAISLKAMAYFTAALRHGNIAKAAEEMNIAASAVSAAIDQVEATFDLTLITRQRSRGIRPNASGRLIARKFDRLLEDYRSVLTEGAELKEALSGTLRIGYYAPVAPAFLPSILSSFLPRDSGVVPYLEECDNNTAQEGLLDGTYDLILFVSEDVHPMIDFDVLVMAPAYCLVPLSHPLADQGSVTMAQISKEPLVVLNRPVAARYYHDLLDTYSNEFNVAAYATSTEMVRSLVGAGHGCAVLNMQPRTQISYCGARVVGLPISDPLPPLPLAIGYDKSRPRRLVQHFVDACRAYFDEPGPQRCLVEAPVSGG